VNKRSTTGALLGILAAATLILLWYGWQWRQALDDIAAMSVTPVPLPVAPSAPMPPSQPDRPLNILVLGTDTLPGQEVGRTDVMVLVHLDPDSGRAAMLSFPRDLWVPIPSQGEARINAAYPFGEARIGPGYGPVLAKQTVSDLVGLPVDHFVMINFEGFITLIDELDGIVVDVPEPLTDPDFPLAGGRRVHVHFDAGPQRMDGSRALIYVRTRHADGDLGRNQRQQQVLVAIFDRLRDQNLLASLAELDEYTGALRDYIRTDLSRDDLSRLLGMAVELRPERVERYAIAPEMLVPLPKPATFTVERGALEGLVAKLCGETCGTLRVMAAKDLGKASPQ
jgi:LCP family protein required for cell wall assembly